MTTSTSRSPFSKTFYVANTMEIFERLAWYGFFTLSSLYMTSPTAQGGLGFTDQERGFLQGIIPFLLYLFPVITGALADRYGYRKMFLLSLIIMTPSYFLLGQVTEFWSFCLVFLSVAIGAAFFKPVVVGTVGRVTDDTNRGLGFGIFYTMVNVGGFLGPLIAGYVRVIGWDMVFVMSSLWIAINFIPALFLYKEPVEQTSDKKPLKEVFLEARQVLGNGRLALLIIPVIIALMISAKGVFSAQSFIIGTLVWIVANIIWDKFAHTNEPSNWLREKVILGDKPFLLYLVILAGFWTVYFQLFITTPLYIRDFVNTSDLVQLMNVYTPTWLDFLAGVNTEQLTDFIKSQTAILSSTTPSEIYFQLVNYKVMVPKAEIMSGLQSVLSNQTTASELAQLWVTNFRQVNPEYIVNLDFGVIVLFQILISTFVGRFKALMVIVFGTFIIAASFLIGGLSHGALFGGSLIATSVILFAFGEMVAAPKSQEYVASIAPKQNTAMYMGYYFVSMALGILFAGLLSGWGYGYLAKELNSPMLMWGLFAAIGIVSAIVLILFNSRYLARWQGNTAVAC